MYGSIELNVNSTVSLSEIAGELRHFENADLIKFVQLLDEYKADADFSRALYNYARQALVEEGIEVDATKSRLERAIAEIKALVEDDQKRGGPPWDRTEPSAVIDGQGDRWELNRSSGLYEHSIFSRTLDNIEMNWGIEERIYG